MTIQAFPSGPFATNAYVIACPMTRHAAIIDPAPKSTTAIKEYIEENGLHVDQILLTHSHWDHIADVKKVKEIFDIPVLVHFLDAPNLERPGVDGIPMMIRVEGVQPDDTFDDQDQITVGNLQFKVIHTPGHSPGGVCFYCEAEDILISGDTLFQGSIGNLSFAGSDAEAMWLSLDRLAKLPPETRVYPGHGPSTTIGAENWLPRAREIFGNQ